MHPFVVLFDLVALFSMCAGQQATTCNVVPKDQYIKYGSDTEVVCQTSCLPGRVFWTLDNQPVDESLSKTVNSSHNVLTLRNFTHHSATLQCHSAQTRQILGGTYIRTYQKPTRLSCVLHHENQDETGVPGLLTCHWQHHASSPNINYTLLYASPSDTNNKSICSSQVTHCTCKSTLRVTGEAWLTVRASTPHWEVDSDRFTFDPYTIMKMRHPLVEVTAFPDRVEVKWSLSVSSRTRHCQVRYAKVQAVNGEIPEPKVLSKTLQHQEKGVETLTEVESCTNYTISVRCAIDKAPWSDWSHEKLVLTGLNKGHVKLRVWRKIADPGENQTRKVHIMWTEIPSTCQGTFTYTIKKTPGANYTYTPCGRPACDVDVNQDAHRISLVVLENQSLLAEESVYVPATGETGLPRVTDIQTSSLKGAILVSWKAPDQPVSGYVIDWTHCGNQYYWKESKYTNTTLFDLLDKKPYNITVTPVFDNKTGQGTQALQVCSRFGDPADVKIISVEASVKTVFVGWNTNSQEECSGAIINYTVYYGTADGPMLNITVDSTRQDINLKDLDPDTQYSVYVEASALTGSTKSNKRVFKTKRFDPSLPVALGVCGIIVIVLVFSVGLFCAIQWKKFNEKPVPNPGLSSLRLWSSTGPQKGMGSFQSFSTPSDSIMDHISTTNTEEPQRTSTSPLATNGNDSPAGENPQEYTDPAVVVVPNVQMEESREQVLCSPGESTALLPSDSSPLSPYRSQSSVEALTSTTVKQCRCVPAKPLEKTAPVTVYVTLDMCDQG